MNQSASESTTSCKNCSFSIIEDGVQIGCRARSMDPTQFFYLKDGVEYRVFKRMCQFKREWGQFSEEMLEKVFDESEIKYNAIVNFKVPDLVEKTIESIKAQQILPTNLILVCYQKYGDIAQEIAQKSGLKWVVHEILDDLVDWRDDVIQKFPNQLHAFIHQGTELAPNYFFNLNQKVNFEDLRFGCIKSDRLLIFPNGLYKMVVKPVRIILEEMESLGFRILDEDFNTKE